MPAGRPSKYDPSILTQIEEYLSLTGRENTLLPTIEGLAEHLRLDTDTLVDWSSKKDGDGNLKYPEFSVAIKRLKNKQKAQLMNDGMYGGKEINSSMAIFLLKANHGLIETERKMLVGADGNNLVIEIVEDTTLKDANEDSAGDQEL